MIRRGHFAVRLFEATQSPAPSDRPHYLEKRLLLVAESSFSSVYRAVQLFSIGLESHGTELRIL